MSRYPTARFLGSAHDRAQFLADDGAEVAVVGRSNSGKSSAINAILERRALARTSRTPGRTQLVNFFGVAPGRRLVDLPGYGYARVTPDLQAHWQALVGAYFEHRRSLAGLFLVVDVRRGLSDRDWQLQEWVSGRPMHVLLTKSDKVVPRLARQALATALAEGGTAFTVQLFSARTGAGVTQAQARLDEMLATAHGSAEAAGAINHR
jgi:GTP-binding protein